MFCKHEWKKLSETVTKSDFETVIESLGDRSGNLKTQADSSNRKHIAIFACDKCGKLKRFVEQL
jgi:heterodisulfide reductase subunit A-like polyferredoxin